MAARGLVDPLDLERGFEAIRNAIARYPALDADAFETLAEIGREVSSLLDLDQLFTRIAQLTKRVVDYRTFGILRQIGLC